MVQTAQVIDLDDAASLGRMNVATAATSLTWSLRKVRQDQKMRSRGTGVTILRHPAEWS